MVELLQNIAGAIEYFIGYLANMGESILLGLSFVTGGIEGMLNMSAFLPPFFGSVVTVSIAVGIVLLLWP